MTIQKLTMRQRIRYALLGIRGALRIPIRTRIAVYVLERLVRNPPSVDYREDGAISVTLRDGAVVLFDLSPCGFSGLAAHTSRVEWDAEKGIEAEWEVCESNRQWIESRSQDRDVAEFISVFQIGLDHMGSPPRAYRWGGER